jgi:hypothetical protein
MYHVRRWGESGAGWSASTRKAEAANKNLLREDTRDLEKGGWAGATRVAMSFAVSLECTVPRLLPEFTMNTSAPNRLSQIKLSYRVKVPLSAQTKIDDTTSFKIPRGSLIEWLPSPSSGLGVTIVRWGQEDYLVSSAELNQNCERVEH